MPEGVRASGAAIFENAHSTLLLAGSRHGTNRRSLQFPHVGASALVYINICLKAARLEEVGAVGVEQRGVDLAGRVLQRQLHRVHPAAAARACGRACGARRQRELRAARPDSGRRAAFRARAAAARSGKRQATQLPRALGQPGGSGAASAQLTRSGPARLHTSHAEATQ